MFTKTLNLELLRRCHYSSATGINQQTVPIALSPKHHIMDLIDPTSNMAAEQGRQNVVVSVSIALTIIASDLAQSTFASITLTFPALSVSLRIFTRSFIVGRMFLDDWAMVVTMIFAHAFLLELTISIRTFNAGYSGAHLSLGDMTGILKVSRRFPRRLYVPLTLS